MIETRDIYWLAGLLEGEGCFSRLTGRSRGITLALKMTDRDVVQKAARLIGYPSTSTLPVYVYTGSFQGRKPLYSWRIRGARAAGVLMMVYPLMGARRKQQIRDMLSYWQSLPRPHGAVRKCLGRCA